MKETLRAISINILVCLADALLYLSRALDDKAEKIYNDQVAEDYYKHKRILR
jgi:hypothetical protein